MNLLCIGQIFPNTGAFPFQTSHYAESREVYLTAELVRLGWSVDLATSLNQNRLPSGVQQIPIKELNPYTRYDRLLFTHNAGLRTVLSTWSQGWQDWLFSHPHWGAVLDGWYPDLLPALKGAKWIGATPTIATRYQEALGPSVRCFESTYAFSIPPDPIPADPYPQPHKPALLYVGRIDDRVLPVLNAIAEGSDAWEVWLACTFFAPWWSRSKIVDGIAVDDSGRSLFSPKIRWLSDLIPWQGLDARYPAPGAKHSHGPALRKDLAAFIIWARVGLNIVMGDTEAQHCKIYDYLGHGLPVVSEEGGVTAGEAILLKAGRTTTRDRWIESLQAELAAPCDKQRIRRAAQLQGSWRSKAERWDRELKKPLE